MSTIFANSETLAYFNHHIIFPFLYCVEKSNQQELPVILKKIHQELLGKKHDTLKDLVVHIQSV